MILSSDTIPRHLCNSGGHFHVAVADNFNPDRHDPAGMYCSRKLNGIRCLIHLRRHDEPIYYTKTGRQITGLDRITEALAPVYHLLPDSGLIVDGELSLTTPDGSDDFNTLVSVIQKKNHVLDRPKFHAFDMVTPAAFAAGRWDRDWFDRRLYLDTLTDCVDTDHFQLLNQERLTGLDHLEAKISRAVQMGWEGLVLRRNAPYSGFITEDTLRLKLWKDTEVPIVGYLASDAGITSIQVTLFGRSLSFTRDQLPHGSLDQFGNSPSQLLDSQATLAWDDGKSISNVRVAAIYPGGRSF